MSSSNSSPEPVNNVNVPNGIAAIVALPSLHIAGKTIPRPAVKNMIVAITQFLSCANNNAKPGKDVLFLAVESLIKRDSRKLSRAWDKTQLTSVLLRWSQEALRLTNVHSQSDLTVEVSIQSHSLANPTDQ